jgi:phosphomannomutase
MPAAPTIAPWAAAGPIAGPRRPVFNRRESVFDVQVASSIFKAYDIRGIVPSTLNEEVALGVGRAFGMAALAAGETVVAVGRDCRLSGPSL